MRKVRQTITPTSAKPSTAKTLAQSRGRGGLPDAPCHRIEIRLISSIIERELIIFVVDRDDLKGETI
jgi:hypothetical protein